MRNIKSLKIFVSLLLVMCTFIGTMRFSGIDADATGSENTELSYWEWNKVTCWDDMQKLGVETNASNMAILVMLGRNFNDSSKFGYTYDQLLKDKNLYYISIDRTVNLYNTSDYDTFLSNNSTKYYTDNMGSAYTFEYKGNKQFYLKSGSEYINTTQIASIKKVDEYEVSPYYLSSGESKYKDIFTFDFARDNPDSTSYFGIKDCCKIHSFNDYCDPKRGFLYNDIKKSSIFRKAYDKYGEYNVETQEKGLAESDCNSNFWIFVGIKKSGIRPDKKGSGISGEGSGYECWKWTKLTSISQCESLGLKAENLSTNESTYRSKLKTVFKTDCDLRMMIVFNKTNTDTRKSIEDYSLTDLHYMSAAQDDNASEHGKYVLQTYCLNTVYDYTQFASGNDIIYTTTAVNLPVPRMETDNRNRHSFRDWQGINIGLWSPNFGKWISCKEKNWEFNDEDNRFSGLNFCFYGDNKSKYGQYYVDTDSCIIHWDMGQYVISWSEGASPATSTDSDLLTGNSNCWVWIGVKSKGNGTKYVGTETMTIDDDTVYSINGVTTIPNGTTINIEAGSTLDINGTMHLGGTINNYGTIVLNKGAHLVMTYNGYDGVINNIGGDMVTLEKSVLDIPHKQTGGGSGYITFRNSTFSVNGDVIFDKYNGSTDPLCLNFRSGNTVDFSSTANLYAWDGASLSSLVSFHSDSSGKTDSVSSGDFPTMKKYSVRNQPTFNE